MHLKDFADLDLVVRAADEARPVLTTRWVSQLLRIILARVAQWEDPSLIIPLTRKALSPEKDVRDLPFYILTVKRKVPIAFLVFLCDVK
eukprot:gene22089-8669_t